MNTKKGPRTGWCGGLLSERPFDRSCRSRPDCGRGFQGLFSARLKLCVIEALDRIDLELIIWHLVARPHARRSTAVLIGIGVIAAASVAGRVRNNGRDPAILHDEIRDIAVLHPIREI